MEKDAPIIELMHWLGEQLGNSFIITDHWEGDLAAVGISPPDNPSQLVYILSFGRPAGRYAVELESAPVAGSDMPYRTIAKFDLVSREELKEIVKDHFNTAWRPTAESSCRERLKSN